jgi:hypothetical protein
MWVSCGQPMAPTRSVTRSTSVRMGGTAFIVGLSADPGHGEAPAGANERRSKLTKYFSNQQNYRPAGGGGPAFGPVRAASFVMPQAKDGSRNAATAIRRDFATALDARGHRFRTRSGTACDPRQRQHARARGRRGLFLLPSEFGDDVVIEATLRKRRLCSCAIVSHRAARLASKPVLACLSNLTRRWYAGAERQARALAGRARSPI